MAAAETLGKAVGVVRACATLGVARATLYRQGLSIGMGAARKARYLDQLPTAPGSCAATARWRKACNGSDRARRLRRPR
jgi:hypothetical protein